VRQEGGGKPGRLRRRRHRAAIERLHAAGVPFRNDVAGGPGGSQILLADPSGGPVELVEPAGA